MTPVLWRTSYNENDLNFPTARWAKWKCPECGRVEHDYYAEAKPRACYCSRQPNMNWMEFVSVELPTVGKGTGDLEIIKDPVDARLEGELNG